MRLNVPPTRDTDLPMTSGCVTVPAGSGTPGPAASRNAIDLRALAEIEKKVLWLSTWMVHNDWQDLANARLARADGGRMAHVETLLEPLARDARLVTVVDGRPASLAWLGAVRGQAVAPLGINAFGQRGDLIDLYRHHQIDTDAIVAAAGRFIG